MTTLGGRYRLDDRIAVGGMGEVWRAHDELLGRDVAVKILKPEYADDPTFVERFEGEARHTAGLAHPGIAAVYDYGEDGPTRFLVMELVEGEPLSALLRREGRLDAEKTLTIVGQAATALHAAHQANVVHRDVKPGNILVKPDLVVKVTDFGIARAVDAVPLTRTGTVLGTAHYIAPEQSMGESVTPASDVYALGVVAYECLAGHRPFDGDSAVRIAMAHVSDPPPPLPDDVPEQVRMLVEQAMAKIPAERFATAGAFARACALLQERLDGEIAEPLAAAVSMPTKALPTASAPEAPLLDVRGRRRTSRAVLVAALAVAGVLLLAALAWAVFRPAAEQHALPKLVGLSRAAAEAELDRLGLDAQVRGEPHRTVARDRVLRTDPAEGTMVAEGSDVVLIVSEGPKPIALPGGLQGRDADAVVGELEALGLTVRRRYEFSDQRTGTVTRVEAAGGLLAEGGTVTVWIDARPEEDKDKGKGEGEGKGEDKDD